jgi:hypothetical protein
LNPKLRLYGYRSVSSYYGSWPGLERHPSILCWPTSNNLKFFASCRPHSSGGGFLVTQRRWAKAAWYTNSASKSIQTGGPNSPTRSASTQDAQAKNQSHWVLLLDPQWVLLLVPRQNFTT